MFTSTFNKGFQITFENGWTISVQYGSGNYCENRNLHGHDMIEWKNRDGVIISLNAEIAIWDENNITNRATDLLTYAKGIWKP